MPLLFVPTPSPYRPHLPSWRQPLYLHLRPLWLALEQSLGTCRGRVLDIGCGLQPYRSFLNPEVTEYVGVDREGPLSSPTVVGDAMSLPFPDESFDVVLSTQVLEHLPKPADAVREAVRVLRRGGRMIVTVPGVWPAHEVPYDYWRFTRYGVEELLRSHDIEPGEIRPLGGMWATLGQMFNLEISRVRVLREIVPVVNRLARFLDARGSREELAMAWFVDGLRKA
jgi:SAM-dependent methyltransferase